MQIHQLISPERVMCCQDATSKKRALESLSALLGQVAQDITGEEIFGTLIDRERLGSTGLGKGVAIPHGRIASLEQPVGAFVVLKQPINFDAIDNQPVDLLFALLVPQESSQEHLEILAHLAAMFGNEPFCAQLRASNDSNDLFKLLNHWESSRESA